MMADPNRDELNYKCLKCKTPVTSLRILDCDIIMSNSRRISRARARAKAKKAEKGVGDCTNKRRKKPL